MTLIDVAIKFKLTLTVFISSIKIEQLSSRGLYKEVQLSK